MRYAELFAGLGLGTLAMRAVFGDDAKCVFYSEIEKNRCALLKELHPGVKNIGDIDYLDTDNVPGFDLLVGGSPCQNLSIANTQTREGLEGHESGLFYQYLELIKEKKPKWFLLENVESMDDKERDEITRCLSKAMGMEIRPVVISSYGFTGQVRLRYYWCNWPILEWPTDGVDPRHCIDKSVVPEKHLSDFIDLDELHAAYKPGGKMKNPKSYIKDSCDWDFVAWSRSTRYKEFDTEKEYKDFANEKGFTHYQVKPGKKKKFKISYVEQRIKINMQANTLLTGPGCSIFSSKNFIRHKTKMRPLTPLECARLQGIPDDHLKGWSDSAAYKAIGDAFTLSAIIHIMKSLKAHMQDTSK
jgi:DNA-cytosine methyltransferase